MSNINMKIESPITTSYLMTIVMLPLASYHLRDIHKSNKYEKCYLENEGQGQGVENGTCAIRVNFASFN